MSTPDYYEYDDGETHFECFDISRYYSGDWAQVIQYVFRWQKKGGVEDLEKALACANDAYHNGIECELIVDNRSTLNAVRRRLLRLRNNRYASAPNFWNLVSSCDGYEPTIIEELKKIIKKAKRRRAYRLKSSENPTNSMAESV